MAAWTHLVRFIAEEDAQIHFGNVDASKYPDVGLSLFKGEKVAANLINGSAFSGTVTEKVVHIKQLLSPLAASDVPIIRCMGLNYRDHAKEANMAIPNDPVLFIKPRTAIAGPFPGKIAVPKFAQDGSSDYEAELSLVISKDGRDIKVEDALDYVLGYTCSNDVSARNAQFLNSQWCFSKGEHQYLARGCLDGSAPIGPVLVSPAAIGDAGKLAIKAIHNSSVVQDSNTKEMIFDIATTISYLSKGTTLERGTIIMTGTGPGIGCMRSPKVVLNHGDDMRVEIEKIGTLINEIYYE
ncbi:Fumarylacetoacetate hydrolase domain-containing protein 2-like protein [Lachnellula hyalina]|uniref:Fumarylacetoacetate hydrolase domain-containing protein 2-like protein n=1 Tax=Lachnellula hyalina TaxID=1316788 RepID=A0A8H8TYW7_9HELO|nr:Fumarylacetoacetate hydrolase domain-containing protein 2-like protein [Lachnellula hyalina]TVY24326.1 Fumarylacetoacetate hydrolase domain-containing protein 2-like protein [Lachnellula hyalina]